MGIYHYIASRWNEKNSHHYGKSNPKSAQCWCQLAQHLWDICWVDFGLGVETCCPVCSTKLKRTDSGTDKTKWNLRQVSKPEQLPFVYRVRSLKIAFRSPKPTFSGETKMNAREFEWTAHHSKRRPETYRRRHRLLLSLLRHPRLHHTHHQGIKD